MGNHSSSDFRDPAAQFEKDTAHLVRLMGYEAEVNKFIAGSQIDVFLTHKTPVETTLYIVECKHWEKNVDKKIVDEVESNRRAADRAKVLLTCRTHYFKDRAETEETVKAKKKGMTESATELYRAIQGRQGHSVGYLQEFGRAQIEAISPFFYFIIMIVNLWNFGIIIAIIRHEYQSLQTKNS